MENKQLKSTETESSLKGAGDKKNLLIGSVIATLIALTPYFYNLYESVPDIKVWHTSFFTYESNYYESLYVVAWTLTNKLIPLFLLFIWFFTNRHWWHHVVLVPIAMYVYQIIIILNDDLSYTDDGQLIYLIPVMAVIIPSIYLIRAKIFNKINEVNKTMEELEEEFKVSPKNFWDKIKQYF